MDVTSCRQAMIRATKWLLSQQENDGRMQPVEHGVATYHKVPLAYALMGQIDRAAALISWIEENSYDDEGDFTGHYPRPPLLAHFYPWSNSWLICGVHRLGHFGLSIPALDFLLTLQHPETGGFLSAGPGAGLRDRQDGLSTATAGLACLYGGQIEAAKAAGQFLLWLWDNQPGGAAAQLYFVVEQTDHIITDFEEELAPYFAVNISHRSQWYHVPALASGFLTLLYEATGEQAYLDGAHQYLQFVEGCASDRYTSETSAFLGWAAAIAFKVTDNANYERIAEQVATYLLATQLENGSWLKGCMGSDITSDVIDATAEGIICLASLVESAAVSIRA